MASRRSSRVEEKPPALPIKQHRSRSSNCSSLDLDCVLLSPVSFQHQSYTHNDVFPEPTDCHAAQCPIHQRYDHSRHQMRFFSDGAPPPIPKKRATRTLSLPSINVPPTSSLSPFQPQRQTQNFGNPLYMLAPIPDTQRFEEKEEPNPVRRSPVPLMSLSQLCFDTPDEQLLYLFSNFDDQGGVSQRIQYHQLLFLRSMAQRMEANILLQEDGSVRDISSYQPEDFLLCKDKKPKQIRDAVYYSVRSSKFPGRVLGLRVHKKIDAAPSAHARHQPLHVNVQEVIVHFQPRSTLKNKSSAPKIPDPMVASLPSKTVCNAAKRPCGGSTESATTQSESMNISLPSALSLLQQGHLVSIERDLLHVTLEDFIQESRSLQSTEPLLYERQVCVLLLQILTGSQHLYNRATAAELRPQDIFLIWPRMKREEKIEGENVNKQVASEIGAMQRSFKTNEEVEWEKKEKGGVQMLWRTQGSPRVVLTPQPPCLSAPHLLAIKSQIGALIQQCLSQKEERSVPTLSDSPYKRGLLYLISWLQNEISGPQMPDMLAMLQVILWGPQIPLLNHSSFTTAAVHNWLSTKRALLVMKMAEKCLIQDQSGLDWDDCLSLQFLSFADSETVIRATKLLAFPLNTG
ncbi:hypothetical protein LDENG_00189390 [Lucifuga dentata]|nr:hypothetical protein LDENG_00189390 [Lucifuga dentata]